MYTLLTKKEIVHLKHEYRIRLAILFIFFLSGALWIGSIGLFPSYVISVTEEHAAATLATKIDNNRQANGEAQMSAQVVATNNLVRTLSAAQDSIFFSSIVEDVVSHRTDGVVITSLSLSHVPNTTNQSSIAISGNALTRDNLVAFERSLEADPQFTKVVLPVSNLARDTDINFNITMLSTQ